MLLVRGGGVLPTRQGIHRSENGSAHGVEKAKGLSTRPQKCYRSVHGPLAHLVEHLICNEGVTGSNPVGSTADDKDMHFCMSFRVCGRRRHVFAVAKTAESGSWNFASGDEQNIPDHKVEFVYWESTL